MGTEKTFFSESTDQSRVKMEIVSKYFEAWANVMLGVKANKIAYIDLFAGPGKYEDGTESTPLLVLKKTIQKPDLRDRLVTIFNDKDQNNISSLQNEINKLTEIDKLKFKPIFYSYEVDDNIAEVFNKINLIPSLIFIDPWGYKGITKYLISAVMKDWGCDCILFFNYKRINMGLNNLLFKEHMNALFGEDIADSLSSELTPLSAEDREIHIIEKLCQAIKKIGPQYVLPFRFKDANGKRTSHHLIFISKHFKGYEIMKTIMAKRCSNDGQGVPSFEYNPIDAKYAMMQPFLFQLSRPLDDLEDMLLEYFAGRTLTMEEIYKEHNVGRPYIKKNYKAVLQNLEAEKKITVSPHRKGTFGDNVRVTFSKFQGGKVLNGR